MYDSKNQPLYNYADIHRQLPGWTHSRVYQAVRQYRNLPLPSIKLGKRMYFNRAEVDLIVAFLKEKK